MKAPKYTFGYLFVRFAKLLAILVLLAGAGIIVVSTNMYFSDASGIGYRRDQNLQRHLDQLENETDFAKLEISRIADVSDLAKLELPDAPLSEQDFDRLDVRLGEIEDRRKILKERLVAAFETKAGKIQTQLIEFLEKRAPAPETTTVPSVAPPPRIIHAAPSRSVFGNPGAEPDRETLDQIGQFLLSLEKAAEKEENKTLLREAQEEISRLTLWLPAKITERPYVPREPRNEAAPAPVNPFVKAQENLGQITRAIFEVRRQVTQDWTLDDQLSGTLSIVEAERDQYRGSIATLNAMRSQWLTKIGLVLLATIVLAFVVLVGADWVQSFFDTATHAGHIRQMLESHTPPAIRPQGGFTDTSGDS